MWPVEAHRGHAVVLSAEDDEVAVAEQHRPPIHCEDAGRAEGQQAGPEVVPVDRHLVLPVEVVVHEDASLRVADLHLREPKQEMDQSL